MAQNAVWTLCDVPSSSTCPLAPGSSCARVTSVAAGTLVWWRHWRCLRWSAWRGSRLRPRRRRGIAVHASCPSGRTVGHGSEWKSRICVGCGQKKPTAARWHPGREWRQSARSMSSADACRQRSCHRCAHGCPPRSGRWRSCPVAEGCHRTRRRGRIWWPERRKTSRASRQEPLWRWSPSAEMLTVRWGDGIVPCRDMQLPVANRTGNTTPRSVCVTIVAVEKE